MTLLAMLIGLAALVFANVPIAVALGVIAAVAIVLTQGTYMLPNVALTMYEGAQSFPLLAIPMFILAGAIMNSSSISRRLMDFASALVGFIRGGLAHVNIIQSMFFAEISGSAVADVAATGPIIMPAMMRRGYSRAFTAAITSSSASLAIIIPPSIPMILYGVMSGTSIVKLFVAGIVPGLLGGFAMMAISYYLALKHDWPVEEAFSLGRVWVTFKETGWALILPLVILGAIFGGVVTATEGAGLAVVAALLIGGLIYRDLDVPHLKRAAVDGVLGSELACRLLDPEATEAAGELALSAKIGGAVHGLRIDRSFIDADGVRWIVDWKTSRHEGGDREAFLDRELERYRPQLERYAQAMRSLEPGRPLKVGLFFPLLDAWREI